MKKLLFFFAFSLLATIQMNAQSGSLSEGSIAIVGLNTDYAIPGYKQKLSIVALEDIPAGTKITFTDRPWISGSGWASTIAISDGYFEWTTPASIIVKGTVVNFDAIVNFNNGYPLVNAVNASIGFCTVPNDFYWGNNNANATFNPEQILAFKGTFNTTSFLYGFSNTDWVYNANVPATTSNLPSNLKNTSSFVALGSNNTNPIDNAFFANGKSYLGVLVMIGATKYLKQKLNDKRLFNTSEGNLVFPVYNFKIQNEPLPPLTGVKFAEWGFSNLYSTQNFRIEATTNPNTANPNIDEISTNGYELYTCGYPNDYNSTNKAGIQGTINTQGYINIKMSFDVYISGNAANSFSIEYLDGSTWRPVDLNQSTVSYAPTRFTEEPIYDILPVAQVYNPQDIIRFTELADPDGFFGASGWLTVQIVLPTSINNSSQLVNFRIVTVGDPETQGDDYATIVYPTANSYHNGCNLFDNIQFFGTPNSNSNNTKVATIQELKEFSNSQLGITPNPTTNHAILNYPIVKKRTIVTVLDMQGKEVLRQTLPEGSTQATIAVEKLTSGVYTVIVNSVNERLSTKLIKE